MKHTWNWDWQDWLTIALFTHGAACVAAVIYLATR